MLLAILAFLAELAACTAVLLWLARWRRLVREAQRIAGTGRKAHA